MLADSHGGQPAGREAAVGAFGRLPGVLGLLAERHAGTRFEGAAPVGDRRRCQRFLGRIGRGVGANPLPTLLGPQDGQCTQRDAEIHSGQGPKRACMKSGWRKSRRRRNRLSTASCGISAPSIARRWTSWCKAERCHSPFTPFRPRTVCIFGSPHPIESSFASIRHRTTRTKNCMSRNTLLGLVFQLALPAQKSWRKLRGFNRLPDVVKGRRF